MVGPVIRESGILAFPERTARSERFFMIRRFAMAAALVAMALTSSGLTSSTAFAKNILETVGEAGTFTILLAAVKTAGLTETLSQRGRSRCLPQPTMRCQAAEGNARRFAEAGKPRTPQIHSHVPLSPRQSDVARNHGQTARSGDCARRLAADDATKA